MKQVIFGLGKVDMKGAVIDGNAHLRLHERDYTSPVRRIREYKSTKESVIEDINKSDVTLTFTNTESIDVWIRHLEKLREMMVGDSID